MNSEFGSVHDLAAVKPIQCSTSYTCSTGKPKSYFEENQLLPSSIGISPLPSAHRGILQHTSVRTSRYFYITFILAKGSSPGFGFSVCYKVALLTLAFTTPSPVVRLK